MLILRNTKNFRSAFAFCRELYSFSNSNQKMSSEITSADLSPPNKKVKQNEAISQDTKTINDFSNFKLKKILNNNIKSKICFLQGTFNGSDEPAIVILEKKAFTESSLTNTDDGYLSYKNPLKKSFINDIYGNYELHPKSDYTGMKATIIYPATEDHIKKFEDQEIYIINETPKAYADVTLPHIIQKQLSLQWVYNILDHGKEKERILTQDDCPENGFVAIPDLKWDGKDVSALYYLAIARKKGIKSIRDLNQTHLPLLKNIRDKVTDAIEAKFGYPKEQLRIFFHYQPSFYHLHIHFVYLKFEASGISCERAHMLDTVINNLELMPDYYQKATLPFLAIEREELFKIFKEKGDYFWPQNNIVASEIPINGYHLT